MHTIYLFTIKVPNQQLTIKYPNVKNTFILIDRIFFFYSSSMESIAPLVRVWSYVNMAAMVMMTSPVFTHTVI